MHRLTLVALLFASLLTGRLQAAEFDLYTNKVLAKVPGAKGVEKVTHVSLADLVDHGGVLKGNSGAFLVVKTNEGRWCKLLVIPGQQKIATVAGEGEKKKFPMLTIEHFVTFKEGEERTVFAQGKDIALFAGFRFNLDIGQIVPAEAGADIRFMATDMGVYVAPVDKAEMYLVTQPLPEAKPGAAAKIEVGEKFLPKYYTGVYKLRDDGRRSGTLHLTVRDDGSVVGQFYSDKDGKKHDVEGKVSDASHKITFKIFYPRTTQEFHGWMFTANGKAFAGWTRLENLETGFYAVREEEK